MAGLDMGRSLRDSEGTSDKDIGCVLNPLNRIEFHPFSQFTIRIKNQTFRIENRILCSMVSVGTC